jgi:hypothetical protein
MYARPLGSYVWQQFISTIEESVQAHLTLVRVFHVKPQWAIGGWPIHYRILHHCRYGGIASNSTTIDATKFTGPHIPHMH